MWKWTQLFFKDTNEANTQRQLDEHEVFLTPNDETCNNSDESEFIDATQVNELDEIEKETQNKNEVFLKNLWVNLTDSNEARN